jgi:type II secretory pathway component PulJ
MKSGVATHYQHAPAAQAGLTLCEVLVASSIMVVVLSIALPFLVTVHRFWQDNEDRATAFDGARSAAVFIGRGVRQARRFGNVPSPSDPYGSLRLELHTPDGDLHQHTYYFDTTNAPPGLGWVRLLDTNVTRNTQTDARLAGPVQTLSFDMRTADGVTAASHPWEAALLRIIATGATGEGEATFPVSLTTLKRRGPVLCALFCAGNLHLRNNTRVTGDVYSGGDLVLDWSARVTNGLAYAAGSVVGNGATVGASPTPAPPFPPLDESYYNDLLAAAQTAPNADLERDSEQILLNGQTLNVHGYAKLRGTAELVGPGTLVTTGKFTACDAARVTGGARVVAARGAAFEGNSRMVGGGLLYAVDYVHVDERASVEADVVTPHDLYIDSETVVSGLVYAGGESLIQGTLRGATYVGADYSIWRANFTSDVGVIRHSIPGLDIRY